MKERASRAKGAYVPVGTECVTEPFVGCLDFYYARNAGLNPDMENFPYVRDLSWLPDGRMEVVPLFPFVYHEHGPTAIQGIYPVEPWSIAEAESFFAWAAARSVLWGGIIVTGTAPASAPPAAREGYLRGLAAARVGFAREFLAYGRMQAPPPLDCEMLDVDHGLSQDGWLRKIRFPAGRTQPPIPPPPDSHSQKGAPKELSVEKWATDLLATPFAVPRNKTLKVPSVLCQPYTLGADRLGILVVNISTQERSLRLPIDPASYGLAPGTYELSKEGPGGRVALGTLDPRKDLDLKLEGAETVLVTARRGGSSGSRP